MNNMTAIQMIVDNAKEPAAPIVDLLRGDQIKIEPIDWLWDGWLARGKLHIIAGVAGTGKTTIALSLATTITTGGRWPDGVQAKLGDVIIWSGEDEPSDTLAPRLKGMGADMRRVHFVNGVMTDQDKRPFDPATDMDALAHAIETVHPALLIVDPIVSAVAGDSHKNTETRRALQPLVDMGSNHGVAVLGISHFSKGSAGRNPTERVTGSLAFAALARVVMAAAKVDDEKGGGRIFCRTKSNIGADDGGFRYDLAQKELDDYPQVFASCVVWGESVTGSAQSLLADAEAQDGEGGSLLAAKEFLETELADGPVSAKTIRATAEQAGHAWRTVQRAQAALGIKPHKDGMKGGWAWCLPSKNANDDEECQQKVLATFGDVGVLREPTAPNWEVEL